ncbi:PIG-L family deacetylase [Ruminococcaceae bacterium OttesenSCG-928-A16]|nr:PIG-L family deacetylase [Ruminococcaceae bacterium OttesenSCG-928-A16]
MNLPNGTGGKPTTACEPKPGPKNRTIMVLAPHPDDEVMMTGGVVKRAVDAGDNVYVLVATLGDYDGVEMGRKRMQESIDAMHKLGLPLGRLLFLNYGDNGGLEQYLPQKFTDSMLYRLYTASSPKQVFTSRAGQTKTYNGAMPAYHYRVFGTQASYTRQNFLGDLQHAINAARPDEIYTTSRFDLHADHAILGMFAGEAIINIRKQNAEYCPTVYEAIVHSCAGDDRWPEKNFDFVGLVPFTQPLNLQTATTLGWGERISFVVPTAMQVVPFTKNLKDKTLRVYASQYSGYIGAFAKKEEVFWARKYNSISYFATVTASSEKSNRCSALDQSAIKAIDGIRDGYSTSLSKLGITSHNRFPFAEWATDGEKEGAWLRLDWEDTYLISRVALYDRPNENDQMIKSKLYFSNGSHVEVGPLPSSGSVLVVNFEAREANWIKLMVEEVSGTTTCVGLAEIEVFGTKLAAN